ncbi:PAS domain S-box-containing protein [Thalassovita litoralis]|uniref:histidine kinase n=1 Tax=Thalassovita litoralis TaxID=1010611 RepID=A0A521E983_9RHOB|nr:PAS domain S-box-containing protein [Thalassovita litoralis]
MPSPKTTSLPLGLRLVSWVSYLAVLIVVVIFFLVEHQVATIRHNLTQQQDANHLATATANRIAENLGRKFSIAQVLKSAIILHPDINQTEFAAFAQTLMLDEPAILDIATIRDHKVTHVYPFEKNHALIGQNLQQNPEQMAVLQAAEQTNQILLQGPMPLLQGVPGYIIRQPIFLQGPDGEKEFWGTASVVLEEHALLEDLGLTALTDRFDIAVRFQSGTQPVSQVLGDPALFKSDAQISDFQSGTTTWSIALAPNTTQAIAPWAGRPMQILLLIFSSLALLIVWYLDYLRREAWQSSARLRASIEVLPDGFALYDTEDRLVLCNNRYRQIYAQSAPAIRPGQKFEDLLRFGLKQGQYPEAVGREEAWLRERLAAHNAANSILEQQTANGQWLRIYERATPEGGRVGIRVDITEQVESRQRAELAERRLQEAIQALPVGFSLFNQREELVIYNKLPELIDPSQVTASGPLTLGQFADLPWRNNPRFQLADRQESSLRALLPHIRSTSCEFLLSLDGDIEYKCFTHRTFEGGIVIICVDITDIKRNKQQLQTTNDTLRRTLAEKNALEQRFADVANTSSEWFWEQDGEMRITFLSSGFERATGLSPDNIVGFIREELSEPATPNESLETLQSVMARQESFRNFIYLLTTAEGKDIWIRTSGNPIFSPEGEFQGYRGVAADVTQLYSALKKAEHADEAKTQFLSVISHELRTPLTAVIGYSSLLSNTQMLAGYQTLKKQLSETPNPGIAAGVDTLVTEVTGFAQKMRSSGKQLQTLIDDILDLARIEANTIKLDIQPIKAQPLIESVVEQMQALATEKGLELTWDAEDVTVAGDDVRLRQVLFNLVGNAIKFTQSGSVSVTCRQDGDKIRFDVADTGIGIPQEQQARIFDRFVQADNSSTRTHKGVGLGLSICRDLLHLQGGTIRLESEPEHGSRFIFYLPVQPTDQQAAAG